MKKTIKTQIVKELGALYEVASQEEPEVLRINKGEATLKQYESTSSKGKRVVNEVLENHTIKEFETFEDAEKYLEGAGYVVKCRPWTPCGKEVKYVNVEIAENYKCECEKMEEIRKARKNIYNEMLRWVQNNGEKTYVRFGEIPENGRSFNYREDRYEEGVSVFAAYKIGNEYVVDIRGGMFTFGGYFNSKKAYEITGNELEAVGGDAEPLLENVEKVAKISKSKIKTVKDIIAEIFN